MQILNSLIPIFAVIGLGAVLRWRSFLTSEMTLGFNRFAYYFALPLFLFYKLGGAPDAGRADRFMLTLLGASMVTLAFAWAVEWLLRSQRERRGALLQASFRGNLAFIGLPLILFVLEDQPPSVAAELQAAVLLAMAPVVIFYNFASVSALAIYRRDSEAGWSGWTVTRQILMNPILLGCAAGMLVQKSGWQIPVALERTSVVVGASAFPLALLGIGSQLATISVRGHWGGAWLATILKCVVCPLAGWWLASLLGLAGVERQVVVILCAVPTAVSSYVLTDQMQGDRELAASAVVLATAVSLITLSVVLIWGNVSGG